MFISWMLIMPSFKKSLIVEQFQGNYLNFMHIILGGLFNAGYNPREFKLFLVQILNFVLNDTLTDKNYGIFFQGSESTAVSSREKSWSLAWTSLGTSVPQLVTPFSSGIRFPSLQNRRNLLLILSPGQTIATCQHNIAQHCWAQHVACVWPPCCDMLGVVGSSLKMVNFEPTTPNTSQHFATRWPNARNMLHPTMLRYVGLACCDRLAGALGEQRQ